jgi:sulfopyruvate decarboxylase TPP-binding subunit
LAGSSYATLTRAGVRQVGYVPDAGHARLIERCRADADIHDVTLTTEEEGVALAAGAWLGGERSALLMQSRSRRAYCRCATAPS